MTQMTTKNLSLFGFSILALIFLIGFTIAIVTFDTVTGDTQSVRQGRTATVTFQLNEDDVANVTNLVFNIPLTLTSGTNEIYSAATVTGNPGTITQNDTTATMTLTFDIPSTQALGSYTGILTPSGTYTPNTFSSLNLNITVISDHPIEIQECSTTGNPGELDVKKIDFTNNGFSGSDFGKDDQWFLMDEIEVEIEIENDGSYDIDDITLEWGLYDTDSEEWIVDFDEEDEFNLKDGDEEIYIVDFKMDDDLEVDIEDLEEGENYRLYVVATGVIDDNDYNEDFPTGSEDTCAFDYETAELIIENDFVVLENIKIPETVECGDTVEIKADVWNTGSDDQDDVYVEITDLGDTLGDIATEILIGDIDAFEKEGLVFTFDVPNNAEEGTHTITFRVLDEDKDVYENDFDDEDSKFTVSLAVEGTCSGESDLTISATLGSEAKAGKALVIKSVITNNANDLETFTISASGFAEWANSVSIDQETIVLNAGESRNVEFTFDVKKDASGEYLFHIETVSSENQVDRQPVSVSIEARSAFGFLEGPSLPWLIGGLNLILIIIIIIVAVKVAKR